jgi:transcription factor SPN1
VKSSNSQQLQKETRRCIEIANMSSEDDDDDLFGGGSDSDDTAELVASAKKKPNKASKKPAPKNDLQDSDDDGKGLFADSDDEEDQPPAAKRKKPPALSKKQRLEALAQKKRVTDDDGPSKKKKEPKKGNDKKGYESDSGDSYDSREFQRTAEDDAFLDTTGEDPDALQEFYADQHFDDERPSDYDEKGKKKKRKIRHGDLDHDDDEEHRLRRGAAPSETGEPDNPIMAAVYRMQKKKRAKKSFSELDEESRHLVSQMEAAADEDLMAYEERRPALTKLTMLQSVIDALSRRDLQRNLLDSGVLSACKRWIQPLPDGKLGNVTVRQRILDVIGKMNHPETGVTASDLKHSEFGKVVFTLYKHPDETPNLKRVCRALIDQWSRPIFQKSGNMRDLAHVQRGADGRDSSLAAVAAQQQQFRKQQAQQAAAAAAAAAPTGRTRVRGDGDLQQVIMQGKKDGGESGINRVRVPFSKGFNFAVRPAAKTAASPADGPVDTRRINPGQTPTASRGKLAKRMVEKGRTVAKNQRSANISVEGRAAK